MSDPRRNIDAMTPAELIAFETQYPHSDPTKRAAIYNALNLTEARYYQLLHRAAMTLEGITANPMTARRVRERGESRWQAREARVSGRAS